MKKLLSFISVIALAIASPFVMSGAFLSNQNQISKADETFVPITTLTGISTSETKTQELQNDIVVDATNIPLNPIGTPEAPFIGVFDGKGKVITIKGADYYVEGDTLPEGKEIGDVKTERTVFNQTAYQGIFGYAKNATFRNIKIICEDLFFDFGFASGSESISEYFAGVLLAYGENVTIENCEVEGTIYSTSNNIETKVTFGGMAGVLAGTSKVKNSGSYVDLNFKYDLTNIYTNRIGGLAGLMMDSASLNFCVGYNSIFSKNLSASVPMTVYQGGLVGNVHGSLVTMFNNVVTCEIATEKKFEDFVYSGAVIGGITKLNSGNIASCGYHATVDGTEVTNFFGNPGEFTYNFVNNSIKDNVVKINSAYMIAENFFKSDNYNDCGLEWYGLLPGWDFDSIWIVANDQAKLQQFQHFEIKLVSRIGNDTPLDAIYNTLIDDTDYTDIDDDYSYGKYAEFNVGFASSEQYQGFYEINDILLDGVSIGYASFKDAPVETDGNIEKLKKYSSDGNYELWTHTDKTTGLISFVFKVKAEYSTRGTYSFRTTEIPYFAYIVAEEGGEVKSASSTTSKQALEPRQLTKNYEWNIKAVPAYQFAFNGWTLWEEITEEVYESNKETAQDYYKHTYTDQVTGLPVYNYWHLIQSTLADMQEVLDAMKKEDFTITFGSEPFMSNFMLKATFVENTYSFNVKDLDLEKISKVEITNSLGETFKFDKDTSNADFITLDQREKITMSVFVRPGFTMEASTMPEKLKAEYLGKSKVEFNGEQCEVHKFSISTQNFKEFANEKEQYSMQIVADVKEEGVAGGLPLWVFIAIGGGALLLIVVVIVIIVKVKRGGGGGGGKKPKASKKGGKSADYDYNQMFR